MTLQENSGLTGISVSRGLKSRNWHKKDGIMNRPLNVFFLLLEVMECLIKKSFFLNVRKGL